MKYIIFKKGKLLMPMMFPDVISHSQIKIEGATAMTAGFFKIGRIGFPVVQKEPSLSLLLKPDPDNDTNTLLDAFLNADSTNCFIDYNNKYKEPNRLQINKKQ